MGSNAYAAGDADEILHGVRITQPFWIASTEITQKQWSGVMGTAPWTGKDFAANGNNYPAIWVSWHDATAFCEVLSEREGRPYRLPTEAEWEYACRAGSQTAFAWGNDEKRIGEFAWHRGNVFDRGIRSAMVVGIKPANAWGLHDMHGNVWEWCHDWYGPYAGGTPQPIADPRGPETGMYRVLRGGALKESASFHRSANRTWDMPTHKAGWVGFRVVLDAPQSTPPVQTTRPAAPQPPSTPVQSPKVAAPAQPQPLPLPASGIFARYDGGYGVAPLTVSTRNDGNHFLVKLVRKESRTTVVELFIRSGQSVSVDVPLGIMELKYASGSEWYGRDLLFGPRTAYARADEDFQFTETTDGYMGYTVELYRQPHGNLDSKKIRPDDF